MKRLSVIIVNYNTKDILRDCLNNLKDKYQNMEIIVVDNGSKDGSSDMVSKEFNWVKLIKTQNNGLAVGNNLGLKESTGDYLLFLGTDAFPKETTLSGMVEYMEQNPKVGLATCKLVLRDGTLDMDAHRGFPTPWAAITHFSKLNKLFPKSKIFNQYFREYEDFNKPHEIDLCISHFLMVKKEVFEKIGTWDESYFLYGEDVDFCYRAKKSGWKIMYLPQWEAVHYKGASIGIRKESKDVTKADDATKKNITNKTTQAMKIFYKKHYKNVYPFFVTGFVLLGIDILSKLRNYKRR